MNRASHSSTCVLRPLLAGAHLRWLRRTDRRRWERFGGGRREDAAAHAFRRSARRATGVCGNAEGQQGGREGRGECNAEDWLHGAFTFRAGATGGIRIMIVSRGK